MFYKNQNRLNTEETEVTEETQKNLSYAVSGFVFTPQGGIKKNPLLPLFPLFPLCEMNFKYAADENTRTKWYSA